jgi:hypothetical protein
MSAKRPSPDTVMATGVIQEEDRRCKSELNSVRKKLDKLPDEEEEIDSNDESGQAESTAIDLCSISSNDNDEDDSPTTTSPTYTFGHDWNINVCRDDEKSSSKDSMSTTTTKKSKASSSIDLLPSSTDSIDSTNETEIDPKLAARHQSKRIKKSQEFPTGIEVKKEVRSRR